MCLLGRKVGYSEKQIQPVEIPRKILCGKHLSDLQMLWTLSHIHSHERSYSDKTVTEDHCPS